MQIHGLEFPDECLYLSEWDTWVRPCEDGSVQAGISALGVKLSGEFYMCRPKSVGSALEQGRSMAVVELSKSVVSVKSPLSGEVLEVNPLLEEEPNLPYMDPYGRGWLVRIRPSAFEQESAVLLRGASLRKEVERRMYLNRLVDTPQT